ncbi:hypothetical protein ACTXT7_008302 [Hymenolepis weldensis]
MKRRAVIVSIKAKHRNLEIVRFLKVAKSFLYKVRKRLNENNGDELATMRRRKQHCRRSADSIRTPEFVRRPPWIDSVANGGRPYAFQQDSAPSHKAPKAQD